MRIKKYIPEFLKDKYIFILIAAYFLMLFFITPSSYIYDRSTFYTWFTYMWNEGFFGLFSHPDVNYMPLYLYVMKGFTYLFHDLESLNESMHYLKTFTLLFDIGGIYLLVRILRHFKIKEDNVFFVLFNIAYIYITLFWAQIDSIHTFFILSSIWLLVRKKLTLSSISLVIAFNFKLQTIIFIPLWILLFIPQLMKRKRNIFKVLIAVILTELIIISPYIYTGHVTEYINIAKGAVDYFQILSMHAFNLWYVVFGPIARWTADTGTFIGITYKSWGILMFIITSFITYFPLLHIVIRKLKQKSDEFTISEYKMVFLVMILTVLNFFYFNTQMHERYLHPLILPLAVYAFLNKRWFIYILISLLYFLNLEKILMLLPVDHLSIIFSSRLIAVMLGLCLLMLYYDLVKLYKDLRMKWKG